MKNQFRKEIIIYTDTLNNLSNSKSDPLFSNSSPIHASIVFANIFRTAENYVNIFTQNLDARIFGKYCLGYLEDFLSIGGVLSVVVCEAPNKESPVLKLIEKYHRKTPQNISIGIATSISIEKIKYLNNGILCNFCFADDRMYRKEFDVNRCLALGSFNRPEEVKELKNYFSVLETTTIYLNVIPERRSL